MAAAARIGDKIKQESPHCHAPIHPPAPTPTPSAHPPKPWELKVGLAPTVKINDKEAATVGAISEPCMLPSCVPNGPGLIAKGSATVMISNLPAARQDDITAHPGCVAPIPSPIGKVIPPCSPNVMIGG